MSWKGVGFIAKRAAWAGAKEDAHLTVMRRLRHSAAAVEELAATILKEPGGMVNLTKSALSPPLLLGYLRG